MYTGVQFTGSLTDTMCVRGQCVEQFGGGEPYLPVLEALPPRHLRKHPAKAVMGDYQEAAAGVWRSFQCQGSSSCSREAG